MQNWLACLNIVAPIFVMVGIGYALQVRGITNENFIQVGTHILFYVIMPCSLFMNLYRSDFTAIFNPGLVVFVVALHLAFVGLLMLLLPRFFPERARCGVVIQGAFRGNILLLGLPLALNMYGADGMGPTALIMAYSIPMYNVLAVVVLSIFAEGEERGKIRWGEIGRKIVTNPLVIGTAAAVPFAALQIHIPEPVTGIISQIGGIGSVFGLFLLGAQMRFSSLRRNKIPVLAAVSLKLVLFPVAAMAAAWLLGFSHNELGAVFILVSAPASISSFIMASSMGPEGELAGQMVFLSTAGSLFTLLGGLYLMTSFGWLG